MNNFFKFIGLIFGKSDTGLLLADLAILQVIKYFYKWSLETFLWCIEIAGVNDLPSRSTLFEQIM